EPARRLVVVGNDERWLGAACARREEARDRGAWFEGMEGAGGGPFALAKDFDDLAGTAGTGHRGEIAIVAADVNGVGERLRKLGTEVAYRRFSEGLQRAVKGACDEALREVIGTARKLPVELLYAGGDDLLVACQGRLALPFAKRVVFRFVQLAKAAPKPSTSNDHWTGGDGLGMSAVAVCFGAGFPFRVAHDIASRLLSDAKREARANGWEEGAVDFVRVTEAYGDPDAILADRFLVSESGKVSLHLTARPFRAAPEGERSLGGFETACKKLSQGFPRSKLFDLCERCSASVYVRPVERVDERKVEHAIKQLNGFLDYWCDRLRRDPVAEGMWKDACQHLVVPSETVLWSSEGVCRTPASDFAEGIDLWGL
ncbi:MAG: Cas10/Cmr2 second palm domain-containing protein, partial [bacterium]